MLNEIKATNFKPNNMVCLFLWVNSINLPNMYQILPILDLNEKVPFKGKKIKIPYYGIEGVIVNIRHRKENRGIRPFLQKSDNFLSVDLQLNQKNIHIKISVNNLLVMNVTSYNDAVSAVSYLNEIINMTNSNIVFLKSCTITQLEQSKQIIYNLYSSIDTEFPTYEYFKKYCSLYDEIIFRASSIFLCYSYELKDIKTNLEYCVNKLLSSEKLPNLTISNSSVVNSIYNYKLKLNEEDLKLNGTLILRTLAFKINNIVVPTIETDLKIKMLIASHHNWRNKYCNIVITIECENKESQVHRFNLSEKGCVRHWSPSDTPYAYKLYKILLCILNWCIIDPDVYI